ncbi:hypothetical protein KIH27_12305 [Mycobacterium sp. M1]|uniref:Uncharacterized protein n=1 Tax=Mycolicibacter acidiphilus TaxID=2835306 RepID=A0ABS5RJ83_9MYCO|nr:hypothetical protein [Mycolicibacter acidiphilus]MBS9534367.1 hypothetical protein [Mycolicibacter acidiphilus]
MTTANHETHGGVSDWSDEVVAEAVNHSCPFCGVQPPENCHGEGLNEFTTPIGHVIKLHTPRLRQVPAFKS